MALLDIVDAVLESTGRPDKELYIRSAINPLIRMIAALKDFPITLVDAPQAVSNTTTIHVIPLPANFRAMAYIRPASRAIFLTPIVASRALQGGVEVVNSYYQRGTDIIVRLQAGYETTELAFGYYAHPALLTLDADTNWIIDTYGDVLSDLLSAKVFRITGDTTTASALEAGVAIRLQEITASSGTAGVVLGG